MPVDNSQQLQHIESVLMQIKSAVDSNKLFDILDILRDAVSDIAHQHEAVRAEIRDLRNLIYQQAATGAD